MIHRRWNYSWVCRGNWWGLRQPLRHRRWCPSGFLCAASDYQHLPPAGGKVLPPSSQKRGPSSLIIAQTKAWDLCLVSSDWLSLDSQPNPEPIPKQRGTKWAGWVAFRSHVLPSDELWGGIDARQKSGHASGMPGNRGYYNSALY